MHPYLKLVFGPHSNLCLQAQFPQGFSHYKLCFSTHMKIYECWKFHAIQTISDHFHHHILQCVHFRQAMIYNIPISSFFTSGICREVGMTSRPVPIPFYWFGLKVHFDSIVLPYSFHNISGKPVMISCFNSFSDSYLIFPLRRCNLPINSWNFKTRI